jgi:hypothetical protein
MSSELEDLNSSTVSNKFSNLTKEEDKFDKSLGIGVAWISALSFAWIATLFVSIATAWAYLP